LFEKLDMPNGASFLNSITNPTEGERRVYQKLPEVAANRFTHGKIKNMLFITDRFKRLK
jgi:hypothetical protein